MLPRNAWNPEFELQNCLANVELDLEFFRSIIPRACREISAADPGPGDSLIPSLSHLEIAILDDPEIARIHQEQMNDGSPTDVITFHHGELLISADTARREAGARKWPTERELLLYLIHGMLHLHGYNDMETADRDAMHRLQESILERLWPLHP
ncbi:MAG: rRNA maturation RNase YbeY [Verrucomicrobiota bacterium]